MNIKQNDMEYLKDMLGRGELTADQANVEKVRMQRVMLVNGSLPISVRKALNGAVKAGYLAHKKKDSLKPEVYYHPTFEYLANKERNDRERAAVENLKKVFA